MEAQLKSLLGKAWRPVVVNGELVMFERSPLIISLQDYKLMFMNRKGTSLEASEGLKLLADYLNRFREKYAGVLAEAPRDSEQTTASVDPYTGALVIESATYLLLRDVKAHRAGVQYQPAVAKVIHDFIAEYTYNYVDLFNYLYHPRLSMNHTSYIVRSHFVDGFFQPLIVQSQGCTSPFVYGEHSWFRSFFSETEKTLEFSNINNKKFDLSCVAMCDIASVFKTKTVHELDRREWMLMAILVVLSLFDFEKADKLSKYYGNLFRHIMSTEEIYTLMNAMMQYAQSARTAVAAR